MAWAPRTALVLAGGGARGAYEVGVIRYLREALPEPARSAVRFDVIAGCSVGALNGCFLAATADRPEEQGRLLQDYWEALRASEVYQFGLLDLLRLPWWLLGRRLEASPTPFRAALLNPAPIERIVREQVSWAGIERNLDAGLLESIAISATDIATGRTHVFVQTRTGRIPVWGRDPRRVGLPARIGPDHALASAAIPLLFPPVAIEGRYYCDGGLRQITPLSPALRLGAERVLVVSLRYEPGPGEIRSYQKSSLRAYPGGFFLLGKMMNALLLDQLDSDLQNLDVINKILETGERVYGMEFLRHLADAVTPVRGVPYQRVKALVLRPSRDLGAIAARHAERVRLGGLWRHLMKVGLWLAAPTDESAEADLLSYLLFDGAYARELAELGFADAAARRDELVDFFSGRAEDSNVA